MPSKLASVLTEQHAVTLLLLGRAIHAPQEPDALASFFRATHAHLGVLQTIVLPFLPESEAARKVEAIAKIVAAQLFTPGGQPSDSSDSLRAFGPALNLLFSAETELLKDMHGHRVSSDPELLQRVEDYYLDQVSGPDVVAPPAQQARSKLERS